MKAWLDGIEIENLLDVDIELGAEKFTEVTLTLLAEVDVELDVDPKLIHNGFRRKVYWTAEGEPVIALEGPVGELSEDVVQELLRAFREEMG
jgi:hypothetical protein